MRARSSAWTEMAAAAILAAGVTPALLRWLRRTGQRRRNVDLRMTVVVEQPIADVFRFCRDFENFPGMLDGLESVVDHQDGRSHWVVRAPGGRRIEWDALVTKYVPNSVIAWRSVDGSPVRASGLMRFAPLDADATRVDLALTYEPAETPLRDAVRAVSAPGNNRRIRERVVRASRELSER